MKRKRLLWAGAAVTTVLILLLATGWLVVHSRWFMDKVRERIVSTVETATGGRAEIGRFAFDGARMQAEITSFTLHGTEAAGKPPLLHASSITVGLKIVSLVKRDVDIQYLAVADPAIYLIIGPDGKTNVPEPKFRRGGTTPVEDLLKLAIGRFEVRNGNFEVEAGGKTPFEARGRQLQLTLLYELTGPRYRGDLSVQPLEVRVSGRQPLPVDVALAFLLEGDRIRVTSGKLANGASQVAFSGSLDDLRSPRVAIQYNAMVAIPQAAKILDIEELRRGTIELAGNAAWAAGADLSASGKLHAYDVDFQDSTVALHNFRADGDVSLVPAGVDVRGLRLTGGGPCSPRARPTERTWPCDVPVGGRIATASLRGRDLSLRGIELSMAGGSFRGEAALRDLKAYTVEGQIADFEARRTVAAYSSEALPWDARASGPVRLEGVFGRKSALRITADIAVTPAPGGAPVTGHISGAYQANGAVLELANSNLNLPSTRVTFSGAVPPVAGRELRVRAETSDLNDVLPALGQSAASIPVKLAGGTARFDGKVTGTVDQPFIAGSLNATTFTYEGRAIDSLTADVTVSPQSIEARNAAIGAGNLRAQFQGTLALNEWKVTDASAIAGNGSIRNADLTALVPLLSAEASPVTGLVTTTAQVSGTVGDPKAIADVEVQKGVFGEEPFDRLIARVNYSSRTIQVISGQLHAGDKHVELSGTFDHAPGKFDEGRVRFQVNTNPMPIEQIQLVQTARPGVKGIVQITGNGDVDIGHSRAGISWRVADLHMNAEARGLQVDGQSLGDARLTAESKAAVLHAHLETNFAGSEVRGDGEWRLENDYPGTATVKFTRLDFARLRQSLSAEESSLDRISGFAEGELRLDGPAWQMDALRARLNIPSFEIVAATPAGGTTPATSFRLQNSGPIIATMVNKVVTIESARLVGRATDLNVGGRVLLQQRNALDLRVNGRLDLAIVQEFNHDFVSSGAVMAEAVVRGPLDSPQMNGRLQFQNAAFSISDLPNGISNANGLVLLTNELRGQARENRATIQSFTGETGGGKVQLTGFAAYNDGRAVLQLRASAREVRVRYPEGVSTVANADLNLTGTDERSQLSGTVTVLRTGFNLQSDFSSFIAKSAEPVRTPAAHNDFLGGMNFDVQIETSPDIQFQSSLTEDLQVEANLRLRGTFSNPALVGRVNISQGQVVFYGTKYSINQGSVAFYNPLKVEPILDIDLDTKAHGIDITLSVSGPLNKLRLTPRSDPPLQFNEIVALLATGRTPTSDPTLLTHQSTAPQSWQQMGASALLGQAIANPVAGRLQRFFGVSKLRIDPTITGVENNPQARLTLEQQVTQEITFTYITNVTSTNPQVVRMEWAFSKQWSVVALRDENGTFGLDFFFKKRF